MRHPKVSDCVEVFDSLWPPALAEPWDSVGLAVGDPDAEVQSILLALDPMDAVSFSIQTWCSTIIRSCSNP